MVILLVVLAIVLAIALGIAVVGLAFKLLWLALVGLVIGALARLVLPGSQPIGWLWTAGVGIAGALLGGVVADAFDVGGIFELLLAVGVAAALIAALGGRRRSYA